MHVFIILVVLYSLFFVVQFLIKKKKSELSLASLKSVLKEWLREKETEAGSENDGGITYTNGSEDTLQI